MLFLEQFNFLWDEGNILLSWLRVRGGGGGCGINGPFGTLLPPPSTYKVRQWINADSFTFHPHKDHSSIFSFIQNLSHKNNLYLNTLLLHNHLRYLIFKWTLILAPNHLPVLSNSHSLLELSSSSQPKAVSRHLNINYSTNNGTFNRT